MDKDKTPLHIDAEGGADTPEIAPENKLAYFPLYLGVVGQPVIICGASKDRIFHRPLALGEEKPPIGNQ